MNEVDEILRRAERTLRAAYLGLKQYRTKDGEEKIIGLYNAISNGRSVTFVLQNLRGKADGFDEWYDERREVLKEDTVCQAMNKIRNKIEKEGSAGETNYMKIDKLNFSDIARKTPEWADGTFLGGVYGGHGFYVERPDGSEARFYHDFDVGQFEAGFVVDELTTKEDIQSGEFVEIDDDLEYYIKVIAELVSDAIDEFGSEKLNP